VCAQCAATGTIAASTAAVGARVWLAAKAPVWLGPRLLRAFSVLAVVAGVLGAGVLAE
jgi:hypothetical protein